MNNKKPIIISFITLFIVFIDQLTKFLASKNLEFNQSITVFKNIFHLTLTKNTGAGFGILKGWNLLLILISIAVIIIILYYYTKIKEKELMLQILAALVLGGTIGNLIDRARFGYVTDFLDFRIWPVFNLADSALTIGIIGLIIYFWKK